MKLDQFIFQHCRSRSGRIFFCFGSSLEHDRVGQFDGRFGFSCSGCRLPSSNDLKFNDSDKFQKQETADAHQKAVETSGSAIGHQHRRRQVPRRSSTARKLGIRRSGQTFGRGQLERRRAPSNFVETFDAERRLTDFRDPRNF